MNSTSKDLRLDKGVASKAVLRSAGDEMQKECDKNYRRGIKVGEVAVTKGHRLKCKKVYHVAVDTYERGQGALKVCSSFLRACHVIFTILTTDTIISWCNVSLMKKLIEPRHEKTSFLHMQKQRRRSASR